MQFEGVTKDDLNYHMIVWADQNELLLFFPNGIICIYESLIPSPEKRRSKCKLREVVKSDYENITAPCIVGDRLVFVSFSH